MKLIADFSENTFEHIKHVNDDGIEFWYARELQNVLEYKEWRNFNNAINKAKTACKNSNNAVSDHFVDVNKMIDLAKSAQREIDDIQLSRYACFLIVQNGDPEKEVIALGQTYFAVKTRQQELIENFDALDEDKKRLEIRNQMALHNKQLSAAAHDAGIVNSIDYAVFQNRGYQGLYGGLGAKDIHKHKGLKKSQQILDHMGTTELAANLFKTTQTEEILKKDKIKGINKANETHFTVGKKVRQTIQELGGTMPEDLPTPDKSIKQIEKEAEKKKLNK